MRPMGLPDRCTVDIGPREIIFLVGIGIKDIFGALICGGELLGEKNTVFFILFIRKVLFCPNFSILLR